MNSVLGLSHHIGAPRDHCLVLPEILVKKIDKIADDVQLEQHKFLKEAAEAIQMRKEKPIAGAVESSDEFLSRMKDKLQEFQNRAENLKSVRENQLSSYENQRYSIKCRVKQAPEDKHQRNGKNLRLGGKWPYK